MYSLCSVQINSTWVANMIHITEIQRHSIQPSYTQNSGVVEREIVHLQTQQLQICEVWLFLGRLVRMESVALISRWVWAAPGASVCMTMWTKDKENCVVSVWFFFFLLRNFGATEAEWKESIENGSETRVGSVSESNLSSNLCPTHVCLTAE